METKDKIYRQSGINDNYPLEVRMFNPDSDFVIPEWLSDQLRCTGVSDNGSICVKVIRTDKSREYFLADGKNRLYVPIGSVIIQDKTLKLKVLTLSQFNLLYEEKKSGLFRKIIRLLTNK